MEENRIIDDWFCGQLEQVYGELREIAPETRERIITHIKVICDLDLLGRKEGLLALEEAIGSIEDETVQSLVMLIVNGTDPVRIMEIFKLGYSASQKSKDDIQKWMDLISYAGLLLIQAGTNPKVIETTLCTLASMDVREEMRKQGGLRILWSDEPNAEELSAIEKAEDLNEQKRMKKVCGYVEVLMKHIRLMDDHTLDRLLQKTDQEDLRRAMYLWDKECRRRILQRGTTRWAAKLSQDYIYRCWDRTEDMLAANRRILMNLDRIVGWGYGCYGSDILTYKDREFVMKKGETCDELKAELRKTVEAFEEE